MQVLVNEATNLSVGIIWLTDADVCKYQVAHEYLTKIRTEKELRRRLLEAMRGRRIFLSACPPMTHVGITATIEDGKLAVVYNPPPPAHVWSELREFFGVLLSNFQP